MESEKPNRSSQYSSYAKYSSLGIQMVLTIGGAVYLGWLLDDYLAFEFPLFMVLFLLIATGGIFYKLYRSVQNDNTDK